MKLRSVILAALLLTAATFVSSQSPAAIVSIEVQVEGARAEDIETSITVAIERILSGLANIQVVRSRTSDTTSYSEATFQGLSSTEAINRVTSALHGWRPPHGILAAPPLITRQVKALLAPNH